MHWLGWKSLLKRFNKTHLINKIYFRYDSKGHDVKGRYSGYDHYSGY